jgi:hypothetical protein
VRVQLITGTYLSLAEVQVFGTGAQASTNLALGKAATQSSTFPGYPSAVAASAVDGNTDGNFFTGSVSSTALYQVSIALGKGDGTFQPPLNYSVPSGPMTSGDFNGDGNADLAFFSGTDVATLSVTILLGNGDGTFRPAVSYPAGVFVGLVAQFSIGSIAVGDFTSDGKADIVVSYSYTLGGPLGSSYVETRLLSGNGDGTFGQAFSYSAAPFLVIADFNGDGKPEAP